MTVADHIQKVLKPNFGAAWEEVGADNEKEETFALASVRTLEGKHMGVATLMAQMHSLPFPTFTYGLCFLSDAV